MEDLTVLLVAVVSFTLFFASLAGAHLLRESQADGERLQDEADALLEAVMTDGRWTEGRGLFLATGLDRTSESDLRGLATSPVFLVVVWDLATDERWTFGGNQGGENRRSAATSGNVRDLRVDPARVTATVWGP